NMRLIEEDSVEMRVSRQESYEQRTVATSDVNDATEGREVVGCGHCHGGHPGASGHGGVEVGSVFRMLCNLGEGIGDATLPERRRSGADAVLELLPRVLDLNSR